MSKTELIKCHDYDEGPFHPISFDPVFKWKITKSEPISRTTPSIRCIFIETTSLFGHKLLVISSPYSYGWFSAECRSLGFGGSGFWLDTNDPEDALYRTELYFNNWAKRQSDFYKKFVK